VFNYEEKKYSEFYFGKEMKKKLFEETFNIKDYAKKVTARIFQI
jgi:hypothetical protein